MGRVRRFERARNIEVAEKGAKGYPQRFAGWIDRGLVEPQHRSGKSGAAVVLNAKNVVEARNLVRLRRGCPSSQRARHLMEDLG